MKNFSTPWGPLELSREPYDVSTALQAWNGTDILLLNWAASLGLRSGARAGVFNDAFGTLSCALSKAGFEVVHFSDSALSQRSTLINLEANGLEADGVSFVDSLSIGTQPMDFILMRIPRNLGLLEFQLYQLRKSSAEPVRTAAGGMTKELPPAVWELFETYLGPTTASLADKKARLLFPAWEASKTLPSPGYPKKWKLAGSPWVVVSHANVFSRDGLDGGTRLFLKNFPKIPSGERVVIDLGCGSGILGLAAARSQPQAMVFCVDESFMSVWSARETFLANGAGRQGVFLTGDCLEDFDKNYADLVMCNPPFHYQGVQTQEVAWKMFDESLRVLKPGGELWVVANRNLGYHKRLAEKFERLRTAGLDDRYIVLSARKGRS